MSEELKPCPFCGGEAYIAEKPYHGNYNRYAICKSCEAETSCYKSDSLAIEAWNTRTTDTEILALRQEVEYHKEQAGHWGRTALRQSKRAETADADVARLREALVKAGEMSARQLSEPPLYDTGVFVRICTVIEGALANHSGKETE